LSQWYGFIEILSLGYGIEELQSILKKGLPMGLSAEGQPPYLHGIRTIQEPGREKVIIDVSFLGNSRTGREGSAGLR